MAPLQEFSDPVEYFFLNVNDITSAAALGA
jgi:hypothetical protein